MSSPSMSQTTWSRSLAMVPRTRWSNEAGPSWSVIGSHYSVESHSLFFCLLPSPLPPFNNEDMPSKKRPRCVVQNNRVSTRAAEKELTCRQADLHASSLLSLAQAVLSLNTATLVDVGDIGSSEWVNNALFFRLLFCSNLVIYLNFLDPQNPRIRSCT
jgi:hypothetical protein